MRERADWMRRAVRPFALLTVALTALALLPMAHPAGVRAVSLSEKQEKA